jgi:hypothetical protein
MMSMGLVLMLGAILLVGFIVARSSRKRCSDPWHSSLFPRGRCPSCGAAPGDPDTDGSGWDWDGGSSWEWPSSHRHDSEPPSHARPEPSSVCDPTEAPSPGVESDSGETCEPAAGGDADAHDASGSWCDDGDGDPGCDLEFD